MVVPIYYTGTTMNSPQASSSSQDLYQDLQSPQGSLLVGDQDLLLERTGSGRVRLQSFVIVEGIEVVEDTPGLMARRLSVDDPNNGVDDTFDAPLAEALVLDPGSENDDEEEELREEELLEILEADVGPDIQSFSDLSDEFNWTEDYSTFLGRAENFQEKVGARVNDISPVDIFCQFWDQPLLETIVEQTNLYAWQTIVQVSETGISTQSRLNDWVETSVSEIYRLIAIMILMGICFLGRIDEYWSTGILGMPKFRSLMSRDRYLLLMKFLHFVNNFDIPERGSDRKILKIKPVLEYLNKKFQLAYSPRRELSLDESLLLWKGRLSWVQCIRTKAARFGIKSYELCEAVSGYVLKIIIYTGKNTTATEPVSGFSSSTAKIVITLANDYLGKGHVLYMDNFYNSVELARFLKSRATDVVGTLNRKRQNTPAVIKALDDRRILRGTVVSRHCGDISVTAWKDVKLVTTVSTFHDGLIQGRRAGQTAAKPRVVEEYNKFMGGVDLKDQKLSMYLMERKRCVKWYIKVFKRLLNISILNAYIIYCSNIGQNKNLTHRQFRYALAAGLIEKFSMPKTTTRTSNNIINNNRLNKSLDHYPEQTSSGDRTSNKQNKFKRASCVRCLAAKKRTICSISCSQCKVFLCVGQCWREYHSLEWL